MNNQPFTELWKTLSQAEQVDLRDKVTRAAKCTYQAFMNWAYGTRSPMPVFQHFIVRELHKMGYDVSAAVLFPRKRR